MIKVVAFYHMLFIYLSLQNNDYTKKYLQKYKLEGTKLVTLKRLAITQKSGFQFFPVFFNEYSLFRVFQCSENHVFNMFSIQFLQSFHYVNTLL